MVALMHLIGGSDTTSKCMCWRLLVLRLDRLIRLACVAHHAGSRSTSHGTLPHSAPCRLSSTTPSPGFGPDANTDIDADVATYNAVRHLPRPMHPREHAPPPPPPLSASCTASPPAAWLFAAATSAQAPSSVCPPSPSTARPAQAWTHTNPISGSMRRLTQTQQHPCRRCSTHSLLSHACVSGGTSQCASCSSSSPPCSTGTRLCPRTSMQRCIRARCLHVCVRAHSLRQFKVREGFMRKPLHAYVGMRRRSML